MSTSAAREGALARRVTGPTALGSDFRRFLRLTWTLAVTQFRLKFYGSVLGYLWQLMRPLLLFGVLFVVFTEFVRLGEAARFYPVVLLTGIVLYTFINEAVSTSVNSLVEREPLLRKIEFPRMAIPCSVVLTAIMNLGLNLLAVIVFALVSGVELHLTLLLAPLVVCVLVVGTLGLALLVSSLFVRYRDIQPITDVFLQILFYGSPIIFPLEVVPENAQPWLMLNPFACVIQQVRHWAIDPAAPGAIAVGGWRVGVAMLLVLAVAVVGFLVFRRRAPYVAEDL